MGGLGNFSFEWEKASRTNRKKERRIVAAAFLRHKFAVVIIFAGIFCWIFFFMKYIQLVMFGKSDFSWLQWTALYLWAIVLSFGSVLAIWIVFDERYHEKCEQLKVSKRHKLSSFLAEREIRTLDQLELLIQYLSSTQKKMIDGAKESLDLFLGIFVGVLGTAIANELELTRFKSLGLGQPAYVIFLGIGIFSVVGLVAVATFALKALYIRLNQTRFKSVFLEECRDLYYELKFNQSASPSVNKGRNARSISFWTKQTYSSKANNSKRAAKIAE